MEAKLGFGISRDFVSDDSPAKAKKEYPLFSPKSRIIINH